MANSVEGLKASMEEASTALRCYFLWCILLSWAPWSIERTKKSYTGALNYKSSLTALTAAIYYP